MNKNMYGEIRSDPVGEEIVERKVLAELVRRFDDLSGYCLFEVRRHAVENFLLAVYQNRVYGLCERTTGTGLELRLEVLQHELHHYVGEVQVRFAAVRMLLELQGYRRKHVI